MIKAVGLYSGGLDSILAVKLLKDQGIVVDVLCFQLGFEYLNLRRRTKHRAMEVSEAEIERQLGVTIQHPDVREEFLHLVFHPQHGYGKAMNPCVDCKIFLLRKARDYMHAHNARFVFTGEVVGQRPMSQQRQTLLQTEKAAGLQGYLLRPLSAKLLDPTIPEQQGWIDREQLLGIAGRNRQEQMQLAERYHLRYPQPGGGCLLTDPHFTERLRQLMAWKPAEQISVEDIQLLKLGRHVYLSETVHVILGRHAIDTRLLQQHTAGRWYGEIQDIPGPFVLVEGQPSDAQFEEIARLAVRYTKIQQGQAVTVAFFCGDARRVVAVSV
jgi:tRNA-uridine 2-sulfurtransferase